MQRKFSWKSLFQLNKNHGSICINNFQLYCETVNTVICLAWFAKIVHKNAFWRSVKVTEAWLGLTICWELKWTGANATASEIKYLLSNTPILRTLHLSTVIIFQLLQLNWVTGPHILRVINMHNANANVYKNLPNVKYVSSEVLILKWASPEDITSGVKRLSLLINTRKVIPMSGFFTTCHQKKASSQHVTIERLLHNMSPEKGFFTTCHQRKTIAQSSLIYTLFHHS